jgi:hypothetical protein
LFLRLDWLVVSAVVRELVSGNSLESAKRAGKNIARPFGGDFEARYFEQLQWLRREFPKQRNRECLRSLQGILTGEQGSSDDIGE